MKRGGRSASRPSFLKYSLSPCLAAALWPSTARWGQAWLRPAASAGLYWARVRGCSIAMEMRTKHSSFLRTIKLYRGREERDTSLGILSARQHCHIMGRARWGRGRGLLGRTMWGPSVSPEPFPKLRLSPLAFCVKSPVRRSHLLTFLAPGTWCEACDEVRLLLIFSSIGWKQWGLRTQADMLVIA